jgi:lactoylglutathione lyase
MGGRMKYLHTMIRVSDPEETIRFFTLLGLQEIRRHDNEAGRFTLIFLANIYESCQRLMDGGVTINRPPRDGRMAFVRSPDNISIELLQADGALPPEEPWASMPNTGHW